MSTVAFNEPTPEQARALVAAVGEVRQETDIAEIRDRAEREIQRDYAETVSTFNAAVVGAVLAASPFVAASVGLAAGVAVVSVGVVMTGPVLAAAVAAARVVAPDVDEGAFAGMVRTLRDRVARDLEDEARAAVSDALTETRGRSEAWQGKAVREALHPKSARWQSHIERVASTAATAAVNEGIAVAAAGVQQRTNRRVVLRWRTRGDSKVRASHRRANGQVRAVGERFQVGTSKLRWPADPLGPPRETISCRCLLVPTSAQ